MSGMHEVRTIDDAAAAEASLDPLRLRILAALKEPGSASTLAATLDMPRQKVNYHLRILESHGLIELTEERRRRNFTERLMQASAASYVISPDALGDVQPDPARSPDRLSARWMLARAARLVRDVGRLLVGAQRTNKPVSTYALDAEIRFTSAADRAAFAQELNELTTRLIAKYHRERNPGGEGEGKLHSLFLAIHPTVPAGAHQDSPELPTTER